MADWQAIESYYDYNGDLTSQVTYFDNGILEEEQYTYGLLTYRILIDDPYSNVAEWQAIESYYDYSGALVARTSYLDSGVVVEEEFDAGSLVSRITVDEQMGGGAFDWAAQFEAYDNDTLVLEATLFDNGDYERADYDPDGSLSILWEYDGDDDMLWQARRTDYDANGAVVEVTLWNDGDILPPELQPDPLIYV